MEVTFLGGSFYRISGQLLGKRDKILELYYLVGELDALTSVAIYENNNEKKCRNPKFIKETSLKITGEIHPLLKKPMLYNMNFFKEYSNILEFIYEIYEKKVILI